MILLASIFSVLAAAFAAKAAKLTQELRAARQRLASAESRPGAPSQPLVAAPPRQFECRCESEGLLWFPVLTAHDRERIVVSVYSGLPHCARCVRALKLVPGERSEVWNCVDCGQSHPGTAADLTATDKVLSDCLREFFRRHPDFAPAPGLSAPLAARAAAEELEAVLAGAQA
jgi:ribosomal protein L37AE/L43A